MKTIKKPIKTKAIALILAALTLFIAAQASAMVEEAAPIYKEGVSQDAPKAPEYAPGELIVKIREGRSLEDIKDLNKMYGVTSTEKVFKDLPTPQDRLKEAKAKLDELEPKDHKSWYWQLDKDSKEYKEYTVKIEKEKEELQGKIKEEEYLVRQIEQREKTAPKDAKIPNLDNILLLKVPAETDILQMTQEYSRNPYVQYAEPNYIPKLEGTRTVPNDPYFPDQWALEQIYAPEAWGESKGGGSADDRVIIAIVDSGVDYTHQDLAAKVIKGYDFAYEDSDPMDDGP